MYVTLAPGVRAVSQRPMGHVGLQRLGVSSRMVATDGWAPACIAQWPPEHACRDHSSTCPPHLFGENRTSVPCNPHNHRSLVQSLLSGMLSPYNSFKREGIT
jgi:hypothetical protein